VRPPVIREVQVGAGSLARGNTRRSMERSKRQTRLEQFELDSGPRRLRSSPDIAAEIRLTQKRKRNAYLSPRLPSRC